MIIFCYSNDILKTTYCNMKILHLMTFRDLHMNMALTGSSPHGTPSCTLLHPGCEQSHQFSIFVMYFLHIFQKSHWRMNNILFDRKFQNFTDFFGTLLKWTKGITKNENPNLMCVCCWKFRNNCKVCMTLIY